jgi:peptide/nickel transport system permease protein
MLSFLFQRFLQALIALFAISVLVFAMMYCVGDPVATLLPQNASQAQRQELRQALGLDRPLAVQYGRYVGRLLHGDLGHSYYTGQPVTTLLAERLPATLELATAALLLSVFVGVPLGMLAGARPRNWLGRAAMGGSLFGISIPTFWLGLILMMVFGVWLGWLPSNQRGETVHALGADWSFLTLDGLRHLVLPAVTLGLYHMAMIMRLVRSEMAETLRRPFIRVCRARGLSEAAVIGRHALRNTLIPVVTVIGLQFGGLLAFSVVTEWIFQWPGLGNLLIHSIHADRPLVVAYLLMTGLVFLGINFLVDLTYALIDPRIRWSAPKDVA